MKKGLLIACAAVAVAATVYAMVLRLEIRRLTEAKTRLDRFCLATKWAVQEDLKDLESDDPRRQQAAMDRFLRGGVMHHNDPSFRMCLDSMPKHSSDCLLSEDVSCRITVAKALEEALQKRYP